MKTKLSHITNIQSGAYFKNLPEGEVSYLQVKDFDADGQLVFPEGTLPMDVKTENHLLSSGDLLFAAKGTTNFCALYPYEEKKAIASSSFWVIKVKDKTTVIPAYIQWYLNRRDVLGKLKMNAVGSSIPSIPKSEIEEIEIELPPVDIQQKIVKIHLLQQQEYGILCRLAELKDRLSERQLIEIIQNK